MDFSASPKSLELYKLIVLYMLNRVDFPLTGSQISDFVLEQGYTDYLTLQLAFSELAEAELIRTKAAFNRTALTITGEGQKTLDYFKARISNAVRGAIDAFLKENSYQLRDQVSVSSNYYKTNVGEYEALLNARDKDTILIEIKLSVPSAELASSICENWSKKNQEVYEALTRMLF